MSLERFIKANLLICPLLVGFGYLIRESLPVIVLPIGVAYVTFVALLGFAWGMSRLTLSLRSD